MHYSHRISSCFFFALIIIFAFASIWIILYDFFLMFQHFEFISCTLLSSLLFSWKKRRYLFSWLGSDNIHLIFFPPHTFQILFIFRLHCCWCIQCDDTFMCIILSEGYQRIVLLLLHDELYYSFCFLLSLFLRIFIFIFVFYTI